jgi:integrase
VASLQKRARSPYWFAFYRDADGKAFCKSTKATNKKEAQRVADAMEAGAKRLKNARHLKETFRAILKDAFGLEARPMSLKAYAAAWLGVKRNEVSPSTYSAYRHVTGSLIRFLGPKADGDLVEIAPADLAAFRNRQAATLSPATASRHVKIVRMLFHDALKDQAIDFDAAISLETVRNARKAGGNERRAFSLPEIQALLAVADPEWRSLIKFGLYTGQRLGDLAALSWGNIDLERRRIRLSAQKTGKRLLIPICDPLFNHLLTLDAGEGPASRVHPKSAGIVKSHGRAAALSNQFAELLVAAGLRSPETVTRASRGKGRGTRRASNALSFHCLRHTAVSLLKDAGVPQAVVQELIGHDSAAMSAVYTHVGEEALVKAAAALPAL